MTEVGVRLVSYVLRKARSGLAHEARFARKDTNISTLAEGYGLRQLYFKGGRGFFAIMPVVYQKRHFVAHPINRLVTLTMLLRSMFHAYLIQ